MSKRQPLSEALDEFRLARGSASLGDYPRALGHYQRAVQLDPAFAEAFINLGIVYQKLDKEHSRESVAALRQAVALDSSNVRAHYNLGVALARDPAQASAAATAFKRALALDPQHRNALYALAAQLNRMGERNRAAAAYRRYRLAMTSARPRPIGGTGPLATKLVIRFVR